MMSVPLMRSRGWPVAVPPPPHLIPQNIFSPPFILSLQACDARRRRASFSTVCQHWLGVGVEEESVGYMGGGGLCVEWARFLTAVN